MWLSILCLRDMRRHPGRTVLTLLSIVIAVAATAAVSIATATTRSAYQQMYRGRRCLLLEIASEKGDRFDVNVSAAAEKIAGVKAALPTIYQPALLRFHGKRLKLVVAGVDLAREVAAGNLSIGQEIHPADARNPSNRVFLEASFGKSVEAHLEDRLILLIARRVNRATVVGLVTRPGPAALGSSMVFMPLEGLQKLIQVRAAGR